jgi:hypothetical protein
MYMNDKPLEAAISDPHRTVLEHLPNKAGRGEVLRFASEIAIHGEPPQPEVDSPPVSEPLD